MFKITFGNGVIKYLKGTANMVDLHDAVQTNGRIRRLEQVKARPIRSPRVFAMHEVIETEEKPFD